ncbi:MAG: hypothetical protein IJV76_03735, partial [Clostridia bacterium]|nr:hypothetical protein [Clostridia bacterium]
MQIARCEIILLFRNVLEMSTNLCLKSADTCVIIYLKVFEKGVRGKNFFQKVFPPITLFDLILQPQIVGDHGDEFAVGRFAAAV